MSDKDTIAKAKHTLVGIYLALSVVVPVWMYQDLTRPETNDDVMVEMAKTCNAVKLKNSRQVTRWVVYDVYAPIRGRQIICNDAKALFVPIEQVERYSKEALKHG